MDPEFLKPQDLIGRGLVVLRPACAKWLFSHCPHQAKHLPLQPLVSVGRPHHHLPPPKNQQPQLGVLQSCRQNQPLILCRGLPRQPSVSQQGQHYHQDPSDCLPSHWTRSTPRSRILAWTGLCQTESRPNPAMHLKRRRHRG